MGRHDNLLPIATGLGIAEKPAGGCVRWDIIIPDCEREGIGNS